MTEPTEEQVEAEMEAATVPILGVEFSSAPMLTHVQRQIATALARVRIEAHAAGRDEAINEAGNVADCYDGDSGVGDAIRALRVRT